VVGRIDDKAIPPVLATAGTGRRRIRVGDPTKSFALTFLMVALTAGFLAPILQAAAISITHNSVGPIATQTAVVSSIRLNPSCNSSGTLTFTPLGTRHPRTGIYRRPCG